MLKVHTVFTILSTYSQIIKSIKINRLFFACFRKLNRYVRDVKTFSQRSCVTRTIKSEGQWAFHYNRCIAWVPIKFIKSVSISSTCLRTNSMKLELECRRSEEITKTECWKLKILHFVDAEIVKRYPEGQTFLF